MITPVRVQCELHGSLALTGKGHATDTAILIGLSGYRPKSVDPDAIPAILDAIRREGRIRAGSAADLFVPFAEATDLLFRIGNKAPDDVFWAICAEVHSVCARVPARA